MRRIFLLMIVAVGVAACAGGEPYGSVGGGTHSFTSHDAPAPDAES